MNKKKILLISSVLLTLSLVTIIFFNNVDNKENNIISNINKNEQVINSNMITMMYETESGSGEYVETKDTTWPETGYIFNENLSGCENGGELEYNSENNTVNLLSNSSDQCYVYFDKYDGVWIDNVSIIDVTGSSVSLNVDATSENGNIINYYYSLNDNEYVSTNTNPIVIDNLNKLTEYNIKIYAVDNTVARSNIYELDVSTTDISVPVINSVEVSDITDSGFTLTVNATSDIGISKYYFIIDSNNVAGVSSENNYIFKNLNVGTEYSVTIYVKDLNGHLSDGYIFNIKTNELSLASYIKHLFTSQGENSLYYHDASLENGANDGSYRFSGANPNNYVCFGSDELPCPSDNLYRIIGVFDNEVKLTKSIYATSSLLGTDGAYSSSYWYRWNSNTGTATWSESNLNTVNLNTNFLNNIGNAWSGLIANHSWKVGGGSGANLRQSNAQTAYNYEVGSNSSSTIYSTKIGLMYISDYYYAATNTYWSYPGLSNSGSSYDYRAATSYNWMYMGTQEWTISPTSGGAIFVSSTGAVNGSMSMSGYNNAVRPVFYLNSDVEYASGSGTESDPIRLKID